MGGVVAQGVQAQLRPPPGGAAPSGGGGTSPLPRGAWRAGAPVAPRPEEGVGGRGEGKSRRGFSPPCPGGVALGPRPSPPSSQAHPPWVYVFSRGCPGSPGAGRSLVSCRWVSLAGGGGGCQCALPPGTRLGGFAGRGAGISPCRGLFPRLLRAGTKAGRFVCAPPSMLHSWVSPICCGPRGALERWCRAAGRQQALRD